MAFSSVYREGDVHSADRVELVRMLYKGAIEATGRARWHLANGQIAERSRQITKTWDILGELRRALDHVPGPELSRSLEELYLYIQKRLLEANAAQSDEPLAEAARLLTTLSTAWDLIPSVEYTY
jgi:flagellar protein FliS